MYNIKMYKIHNQQMIYKVLAINLVMNQYIFQRKIYKNI